MSWSSRRGRKRKNPEQILHEAVADYLFLAIRPPAIWNTFPAGGGGLQRALRLQRAGFQPGWPDIIVMRPAPGNYTVVLGIELKAPKGRMSKAQKAIAVAFAGIDGWLAECRSVEAVERVLRGTGFEVHATAFPGGNPG